ncbi:NAD-dependent epimerase/dehydratase family protein [Flammeovirga yaeyamensis]|uniref:NAD-dependent epimerase/dehydratase family protein n=1 Tax=Flammeovirga yaeyamensis TaxID=367791 RepID=A0AAX1N826_9BACT|nr:MULTISPECIES: NAD-dependent epimerase/dehydratase family protein [Flammeovirga]ANQ50173.2 NAD-dependent epimerase/dehydratase family protein [Flammeovirga sp. MY04]MBB3701438.1 uncharacterized protein YbjT (DUF2867 family) [Flammeovirga yaeyamensis]NMF38530.1 NAD-dependent epimerase/dehydratase family protein [Flammeovirga yaeyamensis]QWG02390.1 NAD-dependent epimerase/dehydratase family protein [Flammeovirga yaeyamensis]
MEHRVALVIGGTGLIGTSLIEQLIDDENYSKIISIARRPLGKPHPKVSEVITHLENIDTLEIKEEINDAFCCLGTTMKKAGSKEAFYKVDHDYVLAFADLSKKLNVHSFNVITAMGSNKNSKVYYNKVKGEVQDHLIKLDFDVLNIYQPSLLLGERDENRLGEDVGKILNKVLRPIIPKKYQGIDGSKVAKSMIKTALESNKKLNILTSDQLQSLGQ